MRKYILIFILCAVLCPLLLGQGSAFHIKGGLTIAQQNYNAYNRQALLGFHGAVSIESLSIENKNALYAQIGYHQRGSRQRLSSYVNVNGQSVPSRSFDWTFNNIGLTLGAKQKFGSTEMVKWFYGAGIRGEYTVKHHIDVIFVSLDDLVNKFVYGVSASVGSELMFSELVGAVIELSVHPDLSNQIYIPAQRSITNPNQIIAEKRVRNLSIELSIGLRLLRVVTYVE